MDLWVTEELQAYLIAQGVGQVPGAAPSLTIPSIWLQPYDGAPSPRRDKTTSDWLENATVTLNDTALGPPQALEAWIEEAFIDVVVRARTVPAARMIHRVVRELIHPTAAHGGRKQWQMGALLVEYSTIWTSEAPTFSDSTTVTRRAGYRFGARRKILAGLNTP